MILDPGNGPIYSRNLVLPGSGSKIGSDATRGDGMATEQKLLAQLAEKDEWIDQLEDSLTRAESDLEQTHRKVRELDVRVDDLSRVLDDLTNAASHKFALKLS